jgi:hypothetical protein
MLIVETPIVCVETPRVEPAIAPIPATVESAGSQKYRWRNQTCRRAGQFRIKTYP